MQYVRVTLPLLRRGLRRKTVGYAVMVISNIDVYAINFDRNKAKTTRYDRLLALFNRNSHRTEVSL